MSKKQAAQARAAAPTKGKHKLTRAERKQIESIIRQAKGDGKAHTAQQTIPYLQMYPDGICRVTDKKYSKSIAFEDINYQLAGSDDKTAIFENWCDFLNYFDASVSVQLSFINQGTQREEAEKAIDIPPQDDAFNSIRSEYAGMLKNQLTLTGGGHHLDPYGELEEMKDELFDAAYYEAKYDLVIKDIIVRQDFSVTRDELKKEAAAMAERQNCALELVYRFFGEDLAMLEKDVKRKKAEKWILENE